MVLFKEIIVAEMLKSVFERKITIMNYSESSSEKKSVFLLLVVSLGVQDIIFLILFFIEIKA